MKNKLLIAFLIILSGCATKIKIYNLDQPISIGKTGSGQEVFLGGFSALVKTAEVNSFLTVTDRGPNAEPVHIKEVGKNLRPFLLPEFSPRIVELKLKDKTFTVTNQILLKDSHAKNLSGLPNLKFPFDETAVDIHGNIIFSDIMGIDSEGLAMDDQGNFWVSEEYRPSLLKFDSNGNLIRRFVPVGSLSKTVIEEYNQKAQSKVIVEELPEKLINRKINRGFEGLAIYKNDLYFILQSPLISNIKTDKLSVPIFKFDIHSEKVIAEYRYEFSSEKTDKIGDMTIYSEGKALVIEQSSTSHKIYKVELNVDPSKTVQKKLLVDLESVGLNGYEKIEGITVIDDKHIAVMADNDFGICSDLDIKTGTVSFDCDKKSVLFVVEIERDALK